MEIILFLFSVITLMNILSFTADKLITLMMLELLMFSLILIYSFYHNTLKNSMFFMILFAIFMVLDSVFGISILINEGRAKTNFVSKLILF